MSEFTQCNFCTFRVMKANQKPGYRLVKRHNDILGMGGTNIYAIPPDVETPKKMYKEFHDTYFVAWFQVLGLRCEC